MGWLILFLILVIVGLTIAYIRFKVNYSDISVYRYFIATNIAHRYAMEHVKDLKQTHRSFKKAKNNRYKGMKKSIMRGILNWEKSLTKQSSTTVTLHKSDIYPLYIDGNEYRDLMLKAAKEYLDELKIPYKELEGAFIVPLLERKS